ncbi:MAG: hypothetical protein ACQR33_03210 [Candidatus Saccharibacteria bacterium]
MHELLATNPEQPSQNELRDLFNDSTKWLKDNCPLLLSTADLGRAPTEYNGLPLLYDLPDYTMKVAGEVIGAVAPDAQQTLLICDTDSVTVGYQPACYRRLGPMLEPEFYAGVFTIFFTKELPSPDKLVAWEATLELRADRGWDMRPISEYAGNPPIHAAEQLRAAVSRPLPPPIGYEKFQAIRAIVDNLSEIKRVMEDHSLDAMLNSEADRIARDKEMAQRLVSLAPLLDIGRAVLLTGQAADSPRFAELNPQDVEETACVLAQYLLMTNQSAIHLPSERVRDITPRLSELTGRIFRHEDAPAVELVATHQHDPELLLRNIGRVDEVITMCGRAYLRNMRIYDLEGNVMFDGDVGDRSPIGAGHRRFVVHLVRKLTRE